MKYSMMITAALALSAGVAMAEQDRSAFAPLFGDVEKEHKSDVSTGVKGVQDAGLTLATVSDIDANGDGRISFDELARFDVKPVSF